MKKLFLASAMIMGFSTLAMAAVQPPLDLRGNSLYTSDFVGAKTCRISAGTAAATNVQCFTGRGVVYGVEISSPAFLATEFLVLFDSGNVATVSSFTAVGVQGNGTTQVLPGASLDRTFARPIQFTNGLSATLTTTPTAGELWTILYRPLNATE